MDLMLGNSYQKLTLLILILIKHKILPKDKILHKDILTY